MSVASSRGLQRREDINVTDADIGEALRTHRHRRRQLLEQTADRSGIGVKVLSRIERGQRPCRVSEMMSLAGALRISPQRVMASAGEISRRREAHPAAS